MDRNSNRQHNKDQLLEIKKAAIKKYQNIQASLNDPKNKELFDYLKETWYDCDMNDPAIDPQRYLGQRDVVLDLLKISKEKINDATIPET